MTTSEHLTFLALLIPTFLLLVAAAISLSDPDTAALVAAPVAYSYPMDACGCERTY